MDESVAAQSAEEKPQPPRRRALLLRIGLCLLSLTAALVVAEGLLRIIELGNPDFNRFYFILADHGEKLLDGTDQQYLTLTKEGDRYSPDLVVLAFFTRNDFFESQSAALSFNAKPFFADDSLRLANVPVSLFASAGPSQAYFQPAAIIHSSALYRLVFLNGIKSYYAASLLSLLAFCDASESLQPTYNGIPVDLAVAILRKTADHLQQRDCPFVVMKFGEFLDESASELSAEFDRKLREDLRGIHYLDLDAAFQQRQLSKKLLTEGAGDYHWNAVGHWHVATILHEFLEQEGLISH